MSLQGRPTVRERTKAEAKARQVKPNSAKTRPVAERSARRDGGAASRVTEKKAKPTTARPADSSPEEGHVNGTNGTAHGNVTPTIWPDATARRLGLRQLLAAFAVTMLLAATGGAAGYLVAESRTDLFAAQSEVVLETARPQIDRFLQTQVVLAESRAVAEDVSTSTGIPVNDLMERMSVDTIAGSQVLQFSVVDEDPAVAVEAVDLWVIAYLERLTIDSSPIIRRVYENRIAELREARASIEEELERYEEANVQAEANELAPPFPSEERRLSLESSDIQGQISGLESQITQLDVERLDEAEASVVTPGYALEGRVSPTPITAAALGIFAGLVLAAGLIFGLGAVRSSGRR